MEKIKNGLSKKTYVEITMIYFFLNTIWHGLGVLMKWEPRVAEWISFLTSGLIAYSGFMILKKIKKEIKETSKNKTIN